MAEEARIEVEDDSLNNPDGDKTPDKKNEEVEDDITPKEEDEDLEKKPAAKKDDKVDRSDIAQKIKYREKYRKAQERIKELENDRDKDRSPQKEVADEKELAAQKYIRDLARREYEEIRRKELDKEARELDKFEEDVDSVLEDYSDLSRQDLLDTIEEYDVPPLTAAKILEKSGKPGASKKDKPRMPSPKRGSGAPAKKKIDDKNKSFYDISRELAAEAKDEGIL